MTRRGFTFIELIIAALIMTIVVVSIYSAFNVGIKAWRKGSTGQGFQKTRLGLLKFQKELKSSFFFSNAPFKGSASEMTFPSVISESGRDKIYIINYYAAQDKDTGAKNLMKRKILFEDKRIKEKEGFAELVFSADSISFQYAYRLNNGSKGFEWRDTWEEDQGKMPSGVKISFKLKNEDEIYSKTMFIPQGELGAE